MLKRFRNQRGAALLETAVTLPLILFVSVGIFEFGRAYQTWQIITNAAREGARMAVLPGTTDSGVRTRVQTYMTDGMLTAAATATVNIDRSATVRFAQVSIGHDGRALATDVLRALEKLPR